MSERIDAHQHFWRYRPDEFPWISAEMPALRQDRLPGDLQSHLRAAGIDGCIAVQARQSLDETLWLLALSREHAFIRGVVGWVDLCAPDAAETLSPFAAEPRLVGIRHLLQDEPDDAFMLRPDFRRGIRALGEAGLTYDLLLFPRHLAHALELAREFPGVRFVIDHLAKPSIAAGDMTSWAPGIRALASRPNVACKVSGMVTEADWAAWKPNDFRPFLDVAFDAFGPDRLLFGSDWPVCELAATYPQVIGIVEEYLAWAAPGAAEAVMGGNAARWYRLAPLEAAR